MDIYPTAQITILTISKNTKYQTTEICSIFYHKNFMLNNFVKIFPTLPLSTLKYIFLKYILHYRTNHPKLVLPDFLILVFTFCSELIESGTSVIVLTKLDKIRVIETIIHWFACLIYETNKKHTQKGTPPSLAYDINLFSRFVIFSLSQ